MMDTVQYSRVPPDLYFLVRRNLQEDHILSQYPSFHESMMDSFEIISIDGKISVYYYKDGLLEIQGDEKNKTFRRIVKQVNKSISKKDYL